MFVLFSLLPPGVSFTSAPHPDELSAWLAALPDEPDKAALLLKKQLYRIRGVVNTHARLKMLDKLLGASNRVVSAFEADLIQARYPLSAELQRGVVIGNDLLKRHARAYTDTVKRLSGKWLGVGLAPILRPALVRAMELEKRRLLLAFRAYTPGSRSAWKNLHLLYRIAKKGGYAKTVQVGASDTPERVYIKALLMTFAEPARLTQQELERVRFYIERHAQHAMLSEGRGSLARHEVPAGCFLVRQQDDVDNGPMRKRRGTNPISGDLVLDCGSLIRKLREQIDGLDHGIMPSKLDLPSVAKRPQYLAMLRSLLQLWSEPPQRRFSRQHFRPRIDLVAGFDDIWSFMTGRYFNRRQTDNLMVAAETTPQISEWSIANESPTGFALQYVSGDTGATASGALIGLSPPTRGTVYICMVRRLVSREHNRVDLGLQKYAAMAIATRFTLQGDASGDKSQARAIVLPHVPTLEGKAAVIALPGTLWPGKRVPFRSADEELTYVTGAAIEQHPDYEIFSLSPD